MSEGSRDGKRFSYEAGEHWTGREWIDGKSIFRRVIEFGALPNATTKNVPHGITDLDRVISVEGVAENLLFGNYLPLSYPTGTARVELLIQGSDVRIVTSDNFSDWTRTHVIIEYTKD